MSDPADGEQSKGNRGAVVGAIIGGLLVGVAAGAFVLAPRLASSSSAADGAATSPAGVEASGAAPMIYTLNDLVLNPAQTAGTRFLMASVALELRDSTARRGVEARDAEVRDVILRTLGSKTIAELANIAQRDSLRDELQGKITSKLSPGAVLRVYFPQFVIQ